MSKLIKKNKGHWFYPVKDFVYDEDYYNKYEKYANTPMGKQILEARLNILKNYKNIVDVGIGNGDLIDHKLNAKGFDVNSVAVKKLKSNNQWINVYEEKLDNFDAVCFFDSFEHIEYPSIILNRIVKSKVVITIPIFYDYNYIFKSRHYRPDEHYHYFTFKGLLDYMDNLGFNCIYISDIEIQLGRHDIYTFIFKKK